MGPGREGRGSVLLIGGPSGTGKTTVAEQLGLRLGIPWLQVDDLRLALQYGRVTLPRRTSDLYFFLETPAVWRLPPERLRDALIAVGEAMVPSIEIVVANHVDQSAPAIIEGDGILPALLARPMVRERALAGHVRAVFLAEHDEHALLSSIRAPGRGTADQTEEELRTEARAKWLYGRWLADGASALGLPVVEARPWGSLVDRIAAALRPAADQARR